MTNKITVVNNVHIAGRGLVVRQLRPDSYRGLVSQFRVLRTGTLFSGRLKVPVSRFRNHPSKNPLLKFTRKSFSVGRVKAV